MEAVEKTVCYAPPPHSVRIMKSERPLVDAWRALRIEATAMNSLGFGRLPWVWQEAVPSQTDMFPSQRGPVASWAPPLYYDRFSGQLTTAIETEEIYTSMGDLNEDEILPKREVKARRNLRMRIQN